MRGKGQVHDAAGASLISREMYPLSEIAGLDVSDPYSLTFTLYYRNMGDENSQLQFMVTDNSGQERTLTVSFAYDSESESENE